MNHRLHTTCLRPLVAAIALWGTQAFAAPPATSPSLDGRVTALETAVTTLQGQVTTLQTTLAATNVALTALIQQLTATNAAVTVNSTDIQTLNGQMAAVQANPLVGLSSNLAYDNATSTLTFSGLNLQLISGGGVGVRNGKGNLILGYNSVPSVLAQPICSIPNTPDQASCAAANGWWAYGQRTGSGNLVVGEGHSYSGLGGVVMGLDNSIGADWATVLGSTRNAATAIGATVTGGSVNLAAGPYSSVSGGHANWASGGNSSVSGGFGHSAPYQYNWAAGTLLEAN